MVRPSIHFFIHWTNIYWVLVAATAKLLPSCPTLCDPIDSSPTDSSVPGILQARTLEWVAISFPNAWKWKVKVKSLSRVQLLVTPWTAAQQAPPSVGFSRQEHWSGCHGLLRLSACYASSARWTLRTRWRPRQSPVLAFTELTNGGGGGRQMFDDWRSEMNTVGGEV